MLLFIVQTFTSYSILWDDNHVTANMTKSDLHYGYAGGTRLLLIIIFIMFKIIIVQQTTTHLLYKDQELFVNCPAVIILNRWLPFHPINWNITP